MYRDGGWQFIALRNYRASSVSVRVKVLGVLRVLRDYTEITLYTLINQSNRFVTPSSRSNESIRVVAFVVGGQGKRPVRYHRISSLAPEQSYESPLERGRRTTKDSFHIGRVATKTIIINHSADDDDTWFKTD